jgi:hypothetical protein
LALTGLVRAVRLSGIEGTSGLRDMVRIKCLSRIRRKVARPLWLGRLVWLGRHSTVPCSTRPLAVWPPDGSGRGLPEP